jgi:Tol biopolymer transport system component
VEIARAIAAALSTAHANGVVHRDLKPANVMLTGEGGIEPKVLDFGLAKAVGPDPSGPGSPSLDSGHSPTVTSFGTMAGVILGTAAYMSPEQARGRAVDKRTDLWALGAIVYEMLTGTAAFGGETISDTLASVLKTEPDWDALPAATPPAVRRVVRRCLKRNAADRLHDAADARIELAHAFDEPEGEAAADAPARAGMSRGLLAAVVALAMVGGAVLGFAVRDRQSSPSGRQGRLVSTLGAPEGVTVNLRELSLALSNDGEQLAFVGIDTDGRSHLYVRRLESDDARRVEGTDGAISPFWSPDGRELGFHSGTRLLRVPVEGGTPQAIAEINGRGGTWNADGTILFAAGGPLFSVDAGGGIPVEVEGTLVAPSGEALVPQFLSDGVHFIYQFEDLGGDTQGVYLGKLGSGETTRLVEGLWNAAWGDGHLLYVKEETLVAQPLDLSSRSLTGEPRRVAGPVLRSNYPFHGFFAIAPSGNRMVYLRGAQEAGLAEVLWVDRSGNELSRPGIQGDLYNPRLSHDGRRLALDVSTNETHGDIWIFDLARGSSRRLTQDPIDESRPVWTPDDSEILFFRVPDLYAIDAGGGSEARQVYGDAMSKITSDASPDGRWVMFNAYSDASDEMRVLDLQSGEAADWLRTEFDERDGRFSPDGNWVAYTSTETSDQEVYVDRFPDRGERFRISTHGGRNPIWRRDGKELFYVSSTNDLMAVPIDMDSDRDPVGTPEKLFSPRLRRAYFDVSPDGERFLLLQRLDPEINSIRLVQNWTE